MTELKIETEKKHDTQSAENGVDLKKNRHRNREAIDFLLRRVRSKVRTRLALEFLLWFLVVLSALILVIFLGAILFPKASGVIALYGFWSISVLFISTFLFGIVVLLTTKPSLYEIANTLQNACSDLRDDIVSALQFSEEDQGFEYLSEAIASEHVERTARQLQSKENEGSLFALIPHRPLLAPVLGTFAALIIILGLYKFTEKKTDDIIAGLLHDVEKIDTQTAKRPLIGDISIQYTFPKYAKRQSEFVNSTGNINTLAGSEVSFKTYPLIAAADFELVLLSEQDSGAEQETIPLIRQSDRTLAAQFIVTKNGSYEIRAVNEKGALVDPLVRSIKVQKDIAPSVSISSHRGEIEVSPEDQIEFVFDVTDDFGVESINGVYYFSGEEKKENRIVIDTPELALIPKTLSGRFVLDLSRIKLQPKDRIVFQIEANDNNSLTGPSTGRSSEIVLHVTSPQNKHLRLIQRQQEIRDAMIDLLGDFLAVPIGNRITSNKTREPKQSIDGIEPDQFKKRVRKYASVNERESLLLDNMDRLVNDLKADPLLLKRDFQTFKGIYARLGASHKKGKEQLFPKAEKPSRKKMRRLILFSTQHERVLETSLIALEGLVRQQKIDAISDTQAEIREIRDRLKALLEKYKKSKDPDLKAAIFREIARLRQRMDELLQRMRTQVQNLPRDHMNMDALEDQELVQKSKDLATGVERIEELLKENDIDGAIKALDELTKNLNELNAQLDSEMDEQQGSGVSELDSELNALMDKVNDLELAQKSIEKNTRELQLDNEVSKKKEVQKLMKGRLTEINALLREQILDARKLSSKALNRNEVRGVSKIQSRLAKIGSALKQNLLENALEESIQSNKEMRSLEFSLELSKSYSTGARSNRKKIIAALSKMQLMIPRQRDISNLLRNIIAEAQKTKNESEESPEFEPIQEEQKKVVKKANELQKEIEKASGKFPMLQSELGESMKKTQKEMKHAEKTLKKKRAQQSLDHQRSALEELRKMKKSMQETMKKERQGNQKKKKGEKVAIPKNGEKSSNIRDEVQKRMKDGKLNDYASEIERYYKSLTR